MPPPIRVTWRLLADRCVYAPGEPVPQIRYDIPSQTAAVTLGN